MILAPTGRKRNFIGRLVSVVVRASGYRGSTPSRSTIR